MLNRYDWEGDKAMTEEESMKYHNYFHIIFILVLALLLISCSSVSKDNNSQIDDKLLIPNTNSSSLVTKQEQYKLDNKKLEDKKSDLMNHFKPYLNNMGELSQQFYNSLSNNSDMQNLVTKMQSYVNELDTGIKLIEKTGIIVDSVYIDNIEKGIPTLLVIEARIKQVDEDKLDELINNTEKSDKKLIFTALKSTVDYAKKTKIGEFSVDRIQIRIGLTPPFVSTRLKYTR